MEHIKNCIKAFQNVLDRSRYTFHPDIYVGGGCDIRYSKLQHHVRIGKRCVIPGSSIGRYSYMGDNCYLPQTNIGCFTSIAPYVVLAAGNHPLHFVSTSPITYRANSFMGSSYLQESTYEDEFNYCDEDAGFLCEIGNDVWISTRATLVCANKALKIGNGAVVAAGAVVVEDVPPYAIVAGVPAKVIRFRFPEETVRKLEAIRWWNREDSEFSKIFPLFSKVDTAIERMTNTEEASKS